jgi:protein ImuB
LHQAPDILPHEHLEVATRPLLMLERPEIAEVMAQVPDGPPIRFRWRKVRYEVTRSEGPERIACEWWKDGRAAHTRDYFRVETSDGHRLWLFRHGLYGRESDSPKWYVHGMFG